MDDEKVEEVVKLAARLRWGSKVLSSGTEKGRVEELKEILTQQQ
jgi:hypothetical protein